MHTQLIFRKMYVCMYVLYSLHGYDKGILIDFILRAVSSVRVVIVLFTMPKWLADSIKEQTHANTGTENHGKIGRIREFRFGILFTEFDVSVTIGHPKDEEGKGRICH